MDETTATEIDRLKTVIRDAIAKLKTEFDGRLAAQNSAIGDLIDARERAVSTTVADLEKAIEKLKAKQDRLEDSDSKQSEAIEELLGADRNIHIQIEKNTRQLDEVQSRLDGTRIAQIKESSLEAMRVVVNQNSDLLAGAGGQLPYREIQSKLQNTLFLGQVLKLLASLFGVGGVLAAGSALLGVGKAPDLGPAIATQATKIEVLTAENKSLKESIANLESRINRFTDRQTSTTK